MSAPSDDNTVHVDATEHVNVVVYSEESSYWSAWRTADALEAQPPNNAYADITGQVVAVLREWGRLYAGELTSFLRKTPLLLHETQESIVALHYLREWWKTTTQTQTTTRIDASEFIALDVCCGKGYFSMFLRYLVTMFWNDEDQGTNRLKLKQIILFDKATESDINWNHINVANANANDGTTTSTSTTPHLELWPDTNIHDYDRLIETLLSYNTPLALTGIHLCKMLSPGFISLVNGLGNDYCIYTCLAPCCVPRSVSKGNKTTPKITVNEYETDQERADRKEYIAQRQTPRSCHCCGSWEHFARQCDSVAVAVATTNNNEAAPAPVISSPCWTCGKMGHLSTDCPTPNVRKPSVSPPMRHVDAGYVSQSSDPFETYCQLLANIMMMQGTSTTNTKVQVHNAGLLSTTSSTTQKEQQHHWNASRKSIFIVAAANKSVDGGC